MYLIDDKYFIKELTIPNLKELTAYEEEGGFDLWIDKEARQCLKDALGYPLFDELDSHIADGKLKDDAPDKWKNLVTGASFQLQGKSVKWEGILVEEGVFKKSVLAYFVYAKWLKHQSSQMSGIGEVSGKSSSAVRVNSTQRYVNVWNAFIEMYQGGIDYSPVSVSYHKGVRFTDYYKSAESTYVSLLDFIRLHPEDYPNASMKIHKPKNTIGI